jgi:hypothetical protein
MQLQLHLHFALALAWGGRRGVLGGLRLMILPKPWTYAARPRGGTSLARGVGEVGVVGDWVLTKCDLLIILAMRLKSLLSWTTAASSNTDRGEMADDHVERWRGDAIPFIQSPRRRSMNRIASPRGRMADQQLQDDDRAEGIPNSISRELWGSVLYCIYFQERSVAASRSIRSQPEAERCEDKYKPAADTHPENISRQSLDLSHLSRSSGRLAQPAWTVRGDKILSHHRAPHGVRR